MVYSKKLLTAALVAGTLLGSVAGTAHAAGQDELQAAVAELGRLNGLVLACEQPALTARLREILVGIAPKTREVGEHFEQATTASYLAFGQSGQDCPDARGLAGQIGLAERSLRAAVGERP